ncbi:MAG: erythromycin esterase family protein [Actinomycetota bacterium]|nr:erythromycin esterase family protein [Actinomycetota bacterium]MDP9303433.1 erythromycin esterase family protein [Actinomycetota bacterium]
MTVGLDELVERASAARFVLLGEASHGTHEFYAVRAQLTKRLIAEHGFRAVAVEADWPDAYRVNCYVRGTREDSDPESALGDFRRFPAWMWRNEDVLEFVHWLREFNDTLPAGEAKVGFYGLDLYSLYGSIAAVLAYLDTADPAAAARARERYACLEHFDEAQAYGYATGAGFADSCEDEAVAQLVDVRRQAAEIAARDGRIEEDQAFSAAQNARLVQNAEAYYRSLYRGRGSSWNLRDRHMFETLEELAGHLQREEDPVRIAVWAHNSHLGDARATEMGGRRELNLGQLVREAHGSDAFLLGFSTYDGTVTAASDWHGPAERKRVRPALAGSYEALLHASGRPEIALLTAADGSLRGPRLQRAIGVVYRPETERVSHYFETDLPRQFDALVHIDRTSAVVPLERSTGWDRGELPDTYPYAV